METSGLGTEATYFQFGLEAGLLSETEVKEWAFAVIEALDQPPYEIIEVAEGNNLIDLLAALSSVQGGRNLKQAGEWLLGRIGNDLDAGSLTPIVAAQKAARVAKMAALDQNIYFTFDVLDDELYLAETKQYGTVDECLVDLKAALRPYESFVQVKHNHSLQARRP